MDEAEGQETAVDAARAGARDDVDPGGRPAARRAGRRRRAAARRGSPAAAWPARGGSVRGSRRSSRPARLTPPLGAPPRGGCPAWRHPASGPGRLPNATCGPSRARRRGWPHHTVGVEGPHGQVRGRLACPAASSPMAEIHHPGEAVHPRRGRHVRCNRFTGEISRRRPVVLGHRWFICDHRVFVAYLKRRLPDHLATSSAMIEDVGWLISGRPVMVALTVRPFRRTRGPPDANGRGRPNGPAPTPRTSRRQQESDSRGRSGDGSTALADRTDQPGDGIRKPGMSIRPANGVRCPCRGQGADGRRCGLPLGMCTGARTSTAAA